MIRRLHGNPILQETIYKSHHKTFQPREEIKIELGLGEKHVGARVAVEQELVLTVFAEGDGGERGACGGVKSDVGVDDAVVVEDRRQHVAEWVLAELVHEGGAATKIGDADGDIGRSATGW